MTAPTDRTGAGRAPVAPPVLGEPGLTVPPAVAPGPGSPPDAGGPVLRGAGPLAGRCSCGHLDVFHNLGQRRGAEVRTGCCWTEAEPCDCPLYQEGTTP